MGIVSYCPQGHRVKVKDHLAGRKGICPTCGAKFRIPLVSVAPIVRSPAAVPAASAVETQEPLEASTLPVAAVVSLDAAIAAGLPPVLPFTPAVAAGRPAAPPAETLEPAADTGHEPEPEPELEVAEEADPLPAAIAEAPAASWCVALPGGEASSPMSGDALLEWLGSGEVAGTELVWRSDWPDWRPIDTVFPEGERGGGVGERPSWP